MGDFPILLASLGLAYTKTDQVKKAEEIILYLEKMEDQQPGVVLDQVALVYANLGWKEKFFKKLEYSIANHSINVLWFYKSPFIPDDINQDERFRTIRQQLQLPV